MLTGGDILGDIIGIVAGHIYYYLKDVVPLQFRKDYLITPNFMRRFDNIGQPDQQNRRRNNFSSDVRSENTANTNNTNNNTNDSNSRGEFQPFSGRGSTWGSSS